MRTWTPDDDLTEDRVRELAMEPVERLWLDPDGLLWSIRIELPLDWARATQMDKEQALRLVFSCGSLKRTVPVSLDTKLGELSHFDLAKLLNEK